MRLALIAGALLASAAATPAFAQEEDETQNERPFSGFYIGGSAGATLQSHDEDETILFDRDLNGSFGDTVTTSTGANAFSTGFCSGTVSGSTIVPVTGCSRNSADFEYSARAGYDFHMGGLVVGVVGEFGQTDSSSSVTAFSTTPASYTITRSFEAVAGLRGRVGTTVLPRTLVYGTAGLAYAKTRNRFTTTNTANSVTTSNDDSETFGFAGGLGVEQMVGRKVSVGIEYLYQRFEEDNDFRVRLGRGTAPATNPFVLGNASGTDFARSGDSFNLHSVRAVLNLRF